MAKKTKVVDKWKLKKWYTVLAPTMFEQKELCEIAANEDKFLINRIIDIGLNELVDNASPATRFTTLSFRVHEVDGNKAKTTLIGHIVAPAYIKTFARRGKSLIHMVVDSKTKDEEEVRLKAIAITAGRISGTTMHNLRKAMKERIEKDVVTRDYEQLMQDIVYGRFVSALFNDLKAITSIRRVEIRKSEKKETFK